MARKGARMKKTVRKIRKTPKKRNAISKKQVVNQPTATRKGRKLDPEKVRLIRNLKANGETTRSLANKFNVSATTINNPL